VHIVCIGSGKGAGLGYDNAVNFLAHVYFADSSEDGIVGQVLGDFVRGSDLGAYPAEIAAAIRLHREIDSYSDQHALTRTAKRRFVSPYRRFAGIIVDVVFDHFLARNWSHYSDVSLPEYAQRVDVALQRHIDLLPAPLKRFTRYMREVDMLTSNLHRQHIDDPLRRIARRSPRLTALADAPDVLWQQESGLRQDFDAFFPELIDHVANWHGARATNG